MDNRSESSSENLGVGSFNWMNLFGRLAPINASSSIMSAGDGG